MVQLGRETKSNIHVELSALNYMPLGYLSYVLYDVLDYSKAGTVAVK